MVSNMKQQGAKKMKLSKKINITNDSLSTIETVCDCLKERNINYKIKCENDSVYLYIY